MGKYRLTILFALTAVAVIALALRWYPKTRQLAKRETSS